MKINDPNKKNPSGAARGAEPKSKSGNPNENSQAPRHAWVKGPDKPSESDLLFEEFIWKERIRQSKEEERLKELKEIQKIEDPEDYWDEFDSDDHYDNLIG